ncbi:MAG: GAF domain-containing protein [Desulfobulbus sp.]
MITIDHKKILDLMTDGITIQDPEFNIIYQNRVMREAFGNRLGEKCYAVYEKRDKICEGCGIQKAIRTGKVNVVLRTGVSITGQLASWENVCVPLYDHEGGKVIAGMEICRDVTHRVTLEAEVRERNIQLGLLNDQLSRQTAELQEALKQREALARHLEEEMEQRARQNKEFLKSKLAEEAFKSSEKRLADLVNFMPDIVMAIDLEGKIIIWNRAAEELTGYKAKDMLGKGNYEHAIPFFGKRRPVLIDLVMLPIEEIRRFYPNVSIQDGIIKGESTTQSEKGEVYLLGTASRLYDSEGNVIGAIECVSNITERKRAEEKIRQLAEYQSAILDNAGYIIITTDANGLITIFNPAAERALGYSAGECIGKLTPTFIHDRNELIERAEVFSQELGIHLEPGFEVFAAKARRNLPNTHEWTFIRKDGSRFPILLSVTALRDPQGEVLGFIGMANDTTERKQTEKELRLNAERTDALLQLSQMADSSLHEITDFALEQGVRLTESEIGYLAFMNEDETVLTMHAWSRQAMKDCALIDKPILYPVEKTGLWGEAVRQRRPVITNEYLDPNPLKKGLPPGHTPIIRHMNVPIFSADRIVAVAGVGNKQSGYNDSDVAQLQLLMGDMWKLVEKKRAEEKLLLNAERMDVLLQLSQMTEATTKELTRFAFDAALRLTRSPLGYLAQVSEDERVMELKLWSREAMEECKLPNSSLQFQVPHLGLLGEAVRQRRPIITNNYDAAQPPMKGTPEGHVKLKRHMSLPVIVDGKVVLVIGVGNKVEEYNETDAHQMTLIMDGMWRLIERKRAEEELAANLWFFESMNRINQVMQSVNTLERMMSDVLDAMLSIFGCDRAFMATPCDPDQTEITIAMERTSPQYPGAFSQAVKVPMSPDVKKLFRALLSNPAPNEIYIGKGLNPEDTVWKTYGIKSQLAIAIRPKVGSPWECGLQQCSHNRVWKPQEKKLFLEISRRLGDMLTSLLSYRDLKELNDQLEVRVERRTAALTRANAQMRLEIAEREKAEQDRTKAQAERDAVEFQLRQAQKLEAVGQLAAGIAHEINTPTQYVGDNTLFLKDSFESVATILQTYDELLRRAKEKRITPELLARVENELAEADIGYLFEQIPSAIQETLDGVDRVSRIVRAMREFSHPGGKEKTPADLNNAIETTTTVARNEWKYVAELKLDLAPDLPLVPCFLGEFNQCILNLVVNAAQAIKESVGQQPGVKGQIIISTRCYGDVVEVKVGDTGPGIPEWARPHIFEPFFTTKDVGKGTGQGLSIVYNTIVKQHGGTASFTTETGKGTTFILSLPVSPLQCTI